jgi:hypothetical protein
MHRVVFALYLLSGAAHASSECRAHAVSSAEQAAASNLVQLLPEVAAWRHGDESKFSTYLGSGEPAFLGGNCYITVFAYVNLPTHLELWHVFAVYLPSKTVLVEDMPSGQFVSLKQWRAGVTRRNQP